MVTPSCFISYSWDNNEHKKWVRSLAEALQRSGVHIFLDQWDIHPGKDIPEYMEQNIRDSDYVLLICTPNFANKANSGKGGVGYEKNIVTGEIYTNSENPRKFIPIIRDTPINSLPSYLKSKAYIDFRNDTHFNDNLETLLRHIYITPSYSRPLLGKKPTFIKTVKNDTDLESNKTRNKISFDINIFNRAYKFAYQVSGLDLDEYDSQEWAEQWVNEYSDKDFDYFIELFKYAKQSSGLSLDKNDAGEWALNFIKENSHEIFELFKKGYKFAYQVSGLDLDEYDSQEWAEQWVNEYSDKDFDYFIELFRYARRASGLSLDKNDAGEWALDKIRKM